MNYIGSKNKLMPFIEGTIKNTVGDIKDKVFCDMFAGTGSVGRALKSQVAKVISNDLEYYSFVLNQNYIKNSTKMDYGHYIEALNDLEPIESGFIYNNYCSPGGRLYFSDENGKKIDAMRTQIQEWQESGEIDEAMFYFLLTSLLESADKVSNVASVYVSYLKKLKKTAQQELILTPSPFEITSTSHEVYNTDSDILAHQVEGDILYLDPPYNNRQYGAYYHLLNTIAKYDEFVPKGVTGQRKYSLSNYCKAGKAKRTLQELIKNANFKYIFLSYNNEGLICEDDIREIFETYGQYDLVSKEYRRFKADSDSNRKHKAKTTREYLHILEKRDRRQ